MAVQILTHGRGRDAMYRHTCGPCGCEFTFLASDAKETFDQRDGTYLEIKCPECGMHAYKSKEHGYHGPG